MRGQAFVTFPSIDLAHRALVRTCTKPDFIISLHLFSMITVFFISRGTLLLQSFQLSYKSMQVLFLVATLPLAVSSMFKEDLKFCKLRGTYYVPKKIRIKNKKLLVLLSLLRLLLEFLRS